jgi:hypothetical protein
MGCTRWLVVLCILFLCQGCSLSDHGVAQSSLGKASSLFGNARYTRKCSLICWPQRINVDVISERIRSRYHEQATQGGPAGMAISVER